MEEETCFGGGLTVCTKKPGHGFSLGRDSFRGSKGNGHLAMLGFRERRATGPEKSPEEVGRYLDNQLAGGGPHAAESQKRPQLTETGDRAAHSYTRLGLTPSNY